MRNEEMLLIPGPTPVVDSIYDAMASETRSHTDPRFTAIYKNAIDIIRNEGLIIDDYKKLNKYK